MNEKLIQTINQYDNELNPLLSLSRKLGEHSGVREIKERIESLRNQLEGENAEDYFSFDETELNRLQSQLNFLNQNTKREVSNLGQEVELTQIKQTEKHVEIETTIYEPEVIIEHQVTKKSKGATSYENHYAEELKQAKQNGDKVGALIYGVANAYLNNPDDFDNTAQNNASTIEQKTVINYQPPQIAVETNSISEYNGGFSNRQEYVNWSKGLYNKAMRLARASGTRRYNEKQKNKSFFSFGFSEGHSIAADTPFSIYMSNMAKLGDMIHNRYVVGPNNPELINLEKETVEAFKLITLTTPGEKPELFARTGNLDDFNNKFNAFKKALKPKINKARREKRKILKQQEINDLTNELSKYTSIPEDSTEYLLNKEKIKSEIVRITKKINELKRYN